VTNNIVHCYRDMSESVSIFVLEGATPCDSR
jgi:hypothetical protein